jgi:hypothetical protein
MAVMRTNRNSGKAVGLLQSMFDARVELRNMTFRLAMSVCSRDVKNQNIMQNATSLIELMGKALPVPDFHTLTVYLSIAMTTRNAIAALEQIWPLVTNHTQRSAQDVTRDNDADESAEKDDSATLFRSMIGAIDNLVTQKRVPDADVAMWKARRYKLDALVGNAVNKIHYRRNTELQKARVVAKYTDSKKEFQKRRSEMVELGLRNPPLSMSNDAWEARKATFKTAGSRRRPSVGVSFEASRNTEMSPRRARHA